MSSKNNGKKKRTSGTHKSRLEKMLERMNSFKVANHLSNRVIKTNKRTRKK